MSERHLLHDVARHLHGSASVIGRRFHLGPIANRFAQVLVGGTCSLDSNEWHLGLIVSGSVSGIHGASFVWFCRRRRGVAGGRVGTRIVRNGVYCQPSPGRVLITR